jgi:lipid A 3-O-deacylase
LQLESAGVRFGLSPASDDHKFHQAEVTANWNLPWAWSLGSRWRLESRIDASAGWLGDPGGDAAIGTVGPSLVLRLEGFPVTLEGGVSPTLLSRQEFATKNLGSYFQFTSHAGLNWDFAPHWRLGYRFQHMSNAGIGSPNPGLNLHMIGVSYLF